MSDLPRATLPATPDAITSALKDLLQSDGWLLLCEMVRSEYGPEAVEREITGALMELSPGDGEGQRAVVGQILKGAHKAREVLTLPQRRIDALSGVTSTASPESFQGRMQRLTRRAGGR